MEMEQTYNPKYPVQTLEKALEIIEALSKDNSFNGLGITELSRQLNIGKSTVHRILDTLMAYGYVDKVLQSSNYRLCWKLYEIGNLVPLQRNIANFDIKALEDVCKRFQETVNLGVRDQDHVILVSKVEPQVALKANYRIGEREPLHATALGKILISEQSDEELKQYFKDKELRAFTPYTKTDIPQLLAELQKVRAQGYAIDDQEYTIGVTCIAMPVRNYNNEIVAAISLTGPSIRLNLSKIIEIKTELEAACERISKHLGFKEQDVLEI